VVLYVYVLMSDVNTAAVLRINQAKAHIIQSRRGLCGGGGLDLKLEGCGCETGHMRPVLLHAI